MRQFLKYATVGGMGMIINLFIVFALVEFFEFWYMHAAVFGFVISLSNNFIWNKLWTFEDKVSGRRNIAKQYVKFFIIAIAALSVNLVFLYIFKEFFGIWYLFAQILAIFVAMIINFIGNKYWTFDVRK